MYIALIPFVADESKLLQYFFQQVSWYLGRHISKLCFLGKIFLQSLSLSKWKFEIKKIVKKQIARQITPLPDLNFIHHYLLRLLKNTGCCLQINVYYQSVVV